MMLRQPTTCRALSFGPGSQAAVHPQYPASVLPPLPLPQAPPPRLAWRLPKAGAAASFPHC